jgi:predicted PurR-regulated permease PerM
MVVVILLGLTIFLLYQFREEIAPLILAVIIAYILSPVANLLQNRFKLHRGLATFLAFTLLAVILIGIFMLITPSLVAQISSLNVDIERIFSQFETIRITEYEILGQSINIDELSQQVLGSLRSLSEPFFGQTLGYAVEVISSLVWVVFVVVVAFYLIKDGHALREWIEGLVPPIYLPDYTQLRLTISEIWSAFFRGQIVLAIVVSTIFTLVGFIIGLPFALAMGFLAGILEFLPTLGHAIWLVIASILALFIGSTWLPLPNWIFMLIVIGMHIIFQQFDLNYLLPRIIGRRVHLPPLVVILGIFAGALLAGFLGILLAAPTIATARVIGRYIYANLVDIAPFPEKSITTPLPPPDPQWWRRRPDHDAD